MSDAKKPDLALVSAILDCLIPGDDKDWPAAGAHGLAKPVVDHLHSMSPDVDVLAVIGATIDPNFIEWPLERQEATLREREAEEPDAFDALVMAAYNMYYTDPQVRQVIERLTGYPTRPPQPEGYTMEPFDDSLLDAVRQQGPLWRRV